MVHFNNWRHKAFQSRASAWQERICCVCGRKLKLGRRRDVRTCGGACRIRLARLRRADPELEPTLDAEGLLVPEWGRKGYLIWQHILRLRRQVKAVAETTPAAKNRGRVGKTRQ